MKKTKFGMLPGLSIVLLGWVGIEIIGVVRLYVYNIYLNNTLVALCGVLLICGLILTGVAYQKDEKYLKSIDEDERAEIIDARSKAKAKSFDVMVQHIFPLVVIFEYVLESVLKQVDISKVSLNFLSLGLFAVFIQAFYTYKYSKNI